MDRLTQADAVLAAALAHSPTVIVPGRALSPMDCDSTIPVTRGLVRACDRAAHPGIGHPVHPVVPVTDVILDPEFDALLDKEMRRASIGRRPTGADRSA
jgi:hypothetical protein